MTVPFFLGRRSEFKNGFAVQDVEGLNAVAYLPIKRFCWEKFSWEVVYILGICL
jgi:hypothetical protein